MPNSSSTSTVYAYAPTSLSSSRGNEPKSATDAAGVTTSSSARSHHEHSAPQGPVGILKPPSSGLKGHTVQSSTLPRSGLPAASVAATVAAALNDSPRSAKSATGPYRPQSAKASPPEKAPHLSKSAASSKSAGAPSYASSSLRLTSSQSRTSIASTGSASSKSSTKYSSSSTTSKSYPDSLHHAAGAGHNHSSTSSSSSSKTPSNSKPATHNKHHSLPAPITQKIMKSPDTYQFLMAGAAEHTDETHGSDAQETTDSDLQEDQSTATTPSEHAKSKLPAPSESKSRLPQPNGSSVSRPPTSKLVPPGHYRSASAAGNHKQQQIGLFSKPAGHKHAASMTQAELPAQQEAADNNAALELLRLLYEALSHTDNSGEISKAHMIQALRSNKHAMELITLTKGASMSNNNTVSRLHRALIRFVKQQQQSGQELSWDAFASNLDLLRSIVAEEDR